ALEELPEFRRRSWRRQHGLLLEILDEFRLPIERHELGIEPVHDRLRHSAGGGQSPPAEGRKVDARLGESWYFGHEHRTAGGSDRERLDFAPSPEAEEISARPLVGFGRPGGESLCGWTAPARRGAERYSPP